ncbi:CaiB/BaiF CoA transferase family protein [Aquibaculum arenosum]|uniref:CoA transferase n=1 Tax=Aquibaculum arenosum TaxID=3032591 RepID=A0ABT5YQT3_9PROT|nr:CoA transferase [Fodinicurvata sp. CAU 1616]MDF2097337.1 CoA transferase [Fodinicurvata sp. CAU 1616]
MVAEVRSLSDEEGAQQTAGTLTGVKVLDLSSYLAGPYGCTLLADFGADVIKIESPQGDMMRNYPSTLEGESRAFLGTNRNKRGIVLDLKNPDGLEAFYKMVSCTDIVVHNFRPSVPPRLGIEYDKLKTIKDDIIYCSVTGFGETGPMKNNGGFDQVLQSMTGICTFQPDLDGSPQLVLGSIVDYYTSALLAYSVTSALYHRERTGQGQYVSCSLLRTALTMQAGRFVWAQGEGREVHRDLRSGRVTGIHPTKEGRLYISAHSTHFWTALCELLGLDELGADARYDTMKKRAVLADELLPALHEALKAHTAEEWEKIFSGRVPCSVVRPIEDMFDHPQVLAENLVTTLENKDVGAYRTMTKPVKFDRAPGPAPFGAPAVGQHSDEILSEHGFSKVAISQLRAKGAVL